MKLAYYFNKKQFGKVIAPLRVMGPRMPPAFGMYFAKIEQLDKKLKTPLATNLLIRHQVARLNKCSFCVDQQRWGLIKWSVDQAKFDLLSEYRTDPLFTDAEKAALDYATELTQEKTVKPETFVRLSKHFSEEVICEIVWLVATEHLLNITNLGLNISSDGLQELIKNKSK
jgi:alkylhydroperoxidase family enzyme